MKRKRRREFEKLLETKPIDSREFARQVIIDAALMAVNDELNKKESRKFIADAIAKGIKGHQEEEIMIAVTTIMVLETWTGIKGTATMKLYDNFQTTALAGQES